MREKDLQFDRKKHLLYSRHAKKVIRSKLLADFGPERGEELWEAAQRQYVEYLKDAPDVGGKKSPHHGTYDSILVFAYCAVLPQRPTVEELQPLAAELFMSGFKLMGKFFDLNKPGHLALAARIFQNVANKDKALQARYPDGFHMEIKPFDKERGVIFYRFTQCPNADFARAHGLLDILPALCNCDHIGLKEIGAGLVRHHTCGRGTECDYCIVGSKSPILKEHPLETDGDGLWISR